MGVGHGRPADSSAGMSPRKSARKARVFRFSHSASAREAYSSGLHMGAPMQPERVRTRQLRLRTENGAWKTEYGPIPSRPSCENLADQTSGGTWSRPRSTSSGDPLELHPGRAQGRPDAWGTKWKSATSGLKVPQTPWPQGEQAGSTAAPPPRAPHLTPAPQPVPQTRSVSTPRTAPRTSRTAPSTPTPPQAAWALLGPILAGCGHTLNKFDRKWSRSDHCWPTPAKT